MDPACCTHTLTQCEGVHPNNTDGATDIHARTTCMQDSVRERAPTPLNPTYTCSAYPGVAWIQPGRLDSQGGGNCNGRPLASGAGALVRCQLLPATARAHIMCARAHCHGLGQGVDWRLEPGSVLLNVSYPHRGAPDRTRRGRGRVPTQLEPSHASCCYTAAGCCRWPRIGSSFWCVLP